MTAENVESGLIARFLVTMPERKTVPYSETEIPTDVVDDYESCVRRLLDLTFHVYGNGDQHPRAIPLSKGAHDLFKAHDTRSKEKGEMKECEERAAFGKLIAVAARLALVFELADAKDPESVREISPRAMSGGIILARWFMNEIIRSYDLLFKKNNNIVVNDLLDFIKRKGGRVTVREVLRNGPRKYRVKNVAKEALAYLVDEQNLNKEDKLINGNLVTEYFIPGGDTGDTPQKPSLKS
jgi:Protein of unknown function (DUF3987)